MSTIQWNGLGEKEYEIGVDRGVLYPTEITGVPWNGLTDVVETSEGGAVESHHYDGVKYLDVRSSGDFSASISAYTYPDEFEEFNGLLSVIEGFTLDNQAVTKTFGLSYRTLKGNDVDGPDFGYKVHLMYDLTATPSTKSYSTMSDNSTPSDMSWTVTGIPQKLTGFRPTAHAIFDSNKLAPELLALIEDILYGTESTDPRLPSLVELKYLLEGYPNVIIIDNGDGTWTAYGPDEKVMMLDDSELYVIEDTAINLDVDTYQMTTNE